MTTERIRYRTIDICDGEKQRVRVAVHHRFEGFWSKFTSACSGCNEDQYSDIGSGCHECGYTGKRVTRFFTPFDLKKWEQWEDARWKRKQRLIAFFRNKNHESNHHQ